jgi:hypothetical protein
MTMDFDIAPSTLPEDRPGAISPVRSFGLSGTLTNQIRAKHVSAKRLFGEATKIG